MNENQVKLASECPIRTGGLQFALCAAEENFETAVWIENRRKQDVSSHINGKEARRSMAHHHCGIGLEFAFKVLYALEILANAEAGDDRWTGHTLVRALGKISARGEELRRLYKEHCAGRLQPIAICVGRHPEYVEKASLDALEGFCEYVDQLGKWATARYDHWQEPGAWMYRVVELEPVLKFGKAAVALANQSQEPVTVRIMKNSEEIDIGDHWTQTPVGREKTRVLRTQVTISAMPVKTSSGGS